MEGDKLAFRTQITTSKPVIMDVTWLCNLKLAKIVKLSVVKTALRNIRAGLLQASLLKNTMN